MSDQSGPYKDIILKNGVDLGEHQLARLDEYHRLLIQWNAKINLVSRKDESNIWPNHILHSLSLLFQINIPENVAVADIGTGGGLPGIPLAIAIPSATFVLIDSVRKKCNALEDIVQRLGLANVAVENARAEDAAVLKKYQSSFDVVVARAVAQLKELISWSEPLSKRRSGLSLALRGQDPVVKAIPLPTLIAMKGGELKRELGEAVKGKRSARVHSLAINFDGINQTTLQEKHIVIVEL